MTDRLRWGYHLFPDHPSFRGVAKSTIDSSREALDAVRGGVLSVARNALAFVLTPSARRHGPYHCPLRLDFLRCRLCPLQARRER
jgi:hypothetical protein